MSADMMSPYWGNCPGFDVELDFVSKNNEALGLSPSLKQ
jgi:hypothetical protein